MSKRNKHYFTVPTYLGNYKENDEATSGEEDATDVIRWILNHQHVCIIFDDVQAERNDGVVLAYLVANPTWWTTHFITFSCLLELKASLCQAVIVHHDEIISAQVGTKMNARACQKLTNDVNSKCDLIYSNYFWNNLKMIVNNIEPICYGTNINQSDKIQVLLMFAGIYLHFSGHPNHMIAHGMKKGI